MILLALACTGDDPAGPTEGSFTALSYNVAGLPQGLSSSDPTRFIPQISPKLNAYDLVLAQEDFSFHEELASETRHPHASIPKVPVEEFVNDGLNRFSQLPFDPVERHRWVACHGLTTHASDCLAEKGFSLAVTHLSDEHSVVVVNLHAEAGGGETDLQVRADGFAQLAEAIADLSGAVIVGGDTNTKPLERPEDAATYDAFLAATGLVEVQQHDPDRDHIDRWFYRSGDVIQLTPSDWAVAEEMISPEGHDLSDHPAIRVTWSWSSL